ncbi:MAG: hypothetical protein H7062_21240 [Candidatus Saccharimonas sp.]|nr:hypothetical protein [Planctomycetaceae bacterium]
MLAALVTMLLGGHVFFAAIVAIIVWRVATRHSRVENRPPAALSADEATRIDVGASPEAGAERSSLAARINSVLHIPAVVLQRLGEAMGSVFDLEASERNRLLIAITWCFVGGIDLIVSAVWGTMGLMNPKRDVPVVFLFAALSLAMSLLSLAVAQCVYVRQNFNHVRGASILGLLPVSVGAFVRIPLSVITLLWQHAPSVKETFATTPWRETDLGRWVGGRWSQSMRRWLGTFGRIAAWSVLCLVLLILTLAFYVIPFGPSDYHVYDGSASPVMSKGDGPQWSFFMDVSGTGRTYGLLPPSHVYLRDTIRLSAPRQPGVSAVTVRLVDPATIEKNGQTQTFTREDCHEFFQALSGKPHPQHADSLFQTIQRINAARDRLPSSQRTPAEQFQSGSSISFAEWMSLQSRVFLHAEPLHANRPLPEFVAASTLLNQELFVVRPGAEQNVSNSCMTAGWLLATLFIGFPLVWLLGVWRIVRRRHRKRTVISESPPTTEV